MFGYHLQSQNVGKKNISSNWDNWLIRTVGIQIKQLLSVLLLVVSFSERKRQYLNL